MAKQGEIDYLRNLGEVGLRHAIRKPFSDKECASYLMEMGALMALLPPLPARLLDVGCGTGWTSVFFAKRGYDVVGVDIAPDMIYHANANRDQEGLENLQFVVSDYEEAEFENEFDCAVFYDSLHHAVDENLALEMVYRALRPGGVCVTSEPGVGHSTSEHSVKAMEEYGVTEKDMPPSRIIPAAKRAGFRQFKVYPHAYHLGILPYKFPPRLQRLVEKYPWLTKLPGFIPLILAAVWFRKRKRDGIVVLVK